MDLLWVIFTLATADLFLGPFASAQNCNENWCTISPNNYRVIEVSKDQPGRITCTIPHPKGQDIRIINQFGEDVRRDSVLTQYIMPVSNKVNPTNKSYELDIVWPEATEIQGRLKIIQCIGLFYGSRHPCRTSLVNIQFTREKDATTTSTEALTTTTEQEIEETTTTISEDTTTTKRDKNEHTVTEKMDPTIGVNKRAVESVRQSNARVANIRSIGESDIFNNSANLCPNHLLLLLFALCLIVCL